ncbi:MAG: helicase c2, partial [bacterium]|nr:helicase c2 [bacterium]
KKCSHFNNCFYHLARKEWFRSHLIIVKHHLFFANLANNLGVLPQFHAVIFDEAHNIEDVATAYFGIEATSTGLRYTLDRLYNPKTGKGYLSRVSEVKNQYLKPIIKAVDVVKQESEKFFSELSMKFENASGLFRLRKPHFIDNNLHLPLKNLVNELSRLKGMVKDTDEAQLEPN